MEQPVYSIAPLLAAGSKAEVFAYQPWAAASDSVEATARNHQETTQPLWLNPSEKAHGCASLP